GGRGSPARAGRTSVSGPGQKRAASRRAGADTVAIVSAIARSFTRTRIGFPSPRPRMATSRPTASAEPASAPTPYTVSVGKTTSSPAASAATAVSIGGLREELPLQAEILPLHALGQLGLEALEPLAERTAPEAEDLGGKDGRVLGAAPPD